MLVEQISFFSSDTSKNSYPYLSEIYKTLTETPTYSKAHDVLFSVIRLILNGNFFSSHTKKFVLYRRTPFLSENKEKTVRFLPELVTSNVFSAFKKTMILFLISSQF